MGLSSGIITTLLSAEFPSSVINADNKMITGGMTGWIIWIFNVSKTGKIILYDDKN